MNRQAAETLNPLEERKTFETIKDGIFGEDREGSQG
jgi:hypothetical protein